MFGIALPSGSTLPLCQVGRGRLLKLLLLLLFGCCGDIEIAGCFIVTISRRATNPIGIAKLVFVVLMDTKLWFIFLCNFPFLAPLLVGL